MLSLFTIRIGFFIGLLISFLKPKNANIFGFIYFVMIFLLSSTTLNIGENIKISIIKNIAIWLSFCSSLTFLNFILFKSSSLENIDRINKKINVFSVKNFKLSYHVFLIFIFYIINYYIFEICFLLKDFNSKVSWLDIIFKLFTYFEFASILSLFLFYSSQNHFLKINLDQEEKRLIGIRYIMIHFFIGFVFLLSIYFLKMSEQVLTENQENINFLTSINNFQFNDNDFLNNYSYLFLLLSLLMNSAFPLFSFWFVKSYSYLNFSLFLIFLTGISKISILLILKMFNYSSILPYIGIFSSIIFLLYLIFENNIRRFLSISILSQNYFLLVCNKNDSNIDFSLNNLFFISIMTQAIFFILFFIILQVKNTKTDLFSELNISARKNKLFLFLLILISLLFIGWPGTPNFIIKNNYINEFKNINSLNYSIIIIYKILNIFIFLFILPYKIFDFKDKNNNIEKILYKKVILYLLSIIFVYLILFYSYIDFLKLLIPFIGDISFGFYIIVSFLIFCFFIKYFKKKYIEFYSSDDIFCTIKNYFSNLFLISSEKITHNMHLIKSKKSFHFKLFYENNKNQSDMHYNIFLILTFILFIFYFIFYKNI
jgi:hypothetical protein